MLQRSSYGSLSEYAKSGFKETPSLNPKEQEMNLLFFLLALLTAQCLHAHIEIRNIMVYTLLFTNSLSLLGNSCVLAFILFETLAHTCYRDMLPPNHLFLLQPNLSCTLGPKNGTWMGIICVRFKWTSLHMIRGETQLVSICCNLCRMVHSKTLINKVLF